MTSTVNWKAVRAGVVSKRFALLGKYPPCPWYRPLKEEFVALQNVLPEEQEHFMNDEVRMFLAGYETENIRFSYNADSDSPVGLKVNPSLDPFMRSAIERFKNIFINIWHIRVYGYVLKHDFSFSLTARAVAYDIVTRFDKLLRPIIEEQCYDLADFGLNTLSRTVATVQSSIRIYANVITSVKKDSLVGGQVLTMLYNLRENAIVTKDMHDLQKIFMVAWKVFAVRVGAWVEQGLLNDSELEFIIWPTSALSPAVCSKIVSNSSIRLDSNDYILIEDLCPSFLLSLLPSIVKCGYYNNMISKANMCQEKASTNWSELNVTKLQRKVHEFEKSKSSVVLKHLRASMSFDTAIRDVMMLLLEGREIDILLKHCQKEGILERPVEEVSKQQLRRVSEMFIRGLSSKIPFVSNFKLSLSNGYIFEELRTSSLVNDAPREPLKPLDKMLLLDVLSIAYTPPTKMEKLIPLHIIQMYTFVFRLYMQLRASITCLSEGLFELGLTRSPSNFPRAAILSALYRNVVDLTVDFADAVALATSNFVSEMAEAESIDAVLKLQKDVVFQIFAESGLNQWRKLAYMMRLVNLVSRMGVSGLLNSTTLTEDYYVILEDVESMELTE
uniref:Gamma-tubulin complex component n=1 Tax=Angiostrongylus cantonensis TaxID=6313 RepID=A0A0K0DEP6_ANGCA